MQRNHPAESRPDNRGEEERDMAESRKRDRESEGERGKNTIIELEKQT